MGAKLDATAAHDKATVRDAAAANDETKRLDEAAAHDKATVRDAPAANDETKRLDATAAHDKATVRDAAAANDETKRFDEAAGHDEATLRDATAANDEAKVRDDAKAALTQLGWKPSIAHLAVTAAASALAADSPLERVIFEALRRCPQRGHTAPPPA